MIQRWLYSKFVKTDVYYVLPPNYSMLQCRVFVALVYLLQTSRYPPPPPLFLLYIYLLFLIDFTLSLGVQIQLESHNYPSYYPDYAYVLWTFQYLPGEDTIDIGYVISFGYVYIGYYDYLRVGRRWDPNSGTEIIFSIGDYYYGYPDNLVLEAGDMFIEFEADSYSEGTGFQLEVNVRNITGILDHFGMYQ